MPDLVGLFKLLQAAQGHCPHRYERRTAACGMRVRRRGAVLVLQVIIVDTRGLMGCIYFGMVRQATLPYSLFMVTLSFVTLNKVVTAQYFAWYLVLAPLIYPSLIITPNLKRSIYLWILSQVNWLFWAYLYEFEHIESALILVFFSSLLFVGSNIYGLIQIDRSYSSVQAK